MLSYSRTSALALKDGSARYVRMHGKIEENVFCSDVALLDLRGLGQMLLDNKKKEERTLLWVIKLFQYRCFSVRQR